jgi:hypothetical protein
MFFGVGIILSKPVSPPTDNEAVILRNTLVEAFVTHLRNLLLFLYPQGPGADDVISDDFFADAVKDWRTNRRKITPALTDARTRAHKEISHLTVLRRDGRGKSKDWPILQLMQEIKPVLQAFVDHASAAKLDPSVKTVVDSIDLTITSRTVTDASSKTIIVGGLSATNQPTFVSSSFPQPHKSKKN